MQTPQPSSFVTCSNWGDVRGPLPPTPTRHLASNFIPMAQTTYRGYTIFTVEHRKLVDWIVHDTFQTTLTGETFRLIGQIGFDEGHPDRIIQPRLIKKSMEDKQDGNDEGLCVCQPKGGVIFSACAKTAFSAGDFIADIVGEVVVHETPEDDDDNSLFFVGETRVHGEWKSLMIEISSACKAYFCRHAVREGEANAEVLVYNADGTVRLGLFATRGLQKGEVVVQEWGPEYYG